MTPLLPATASAAPTASELQAVLAAGQLDIVRASEQWLARARALDAKLHLFACLDDRVVRLQAAQRHAEQARGDLPGPLFGVPVAVKDIIDTADLPTAHGSPIHSGRQPTADATVVRRLRDAGAIIFGKTVTTEFATSEPGPTRNPHHPGHTPGGSSSGSAAAVAAGVVPVALGTQTNGSVLRPASYCGVYGFKPSRGLLPRSGILPQSPTLDQVGVFTRSIEDAALVVELLSGDDGHDAASLSLPPRRLVAVACAQAPTPPRLGFVQTPWWPQLDADAREACTSFLARMQGVVESVELPPETEAAVRWLSVINEVELAFALRAEYRSHRGGLSRVLAGRIEQALKISAADYLAARHGMAEIGRILARLFERFDVLLSPAALGGAPAGLASTGNPIMQTLWTLAGVPAVSLPLLTVANGLPYGVQAAGALHDDARLLRACRWLVAEHERRAAG